MKRCLVIIGLIIILLLPSVSLSCSTASTTDTHIQAALGEEFILPLGQTVDLTGEDLWLKFVSVTSDSRCPTGVECIWAGEANCRMEIQMGETHSWPTFIQSGSSVSEYGFQRYIFTFKLMPYPEAGNEIQDSEYYLMITITR